MPYSYAIYTGNGSQTQYAVSFPYIRKEHIVAYVNYSLTTAFTWVNDSTIQFATAPGNGQRVEIRRYSPTNARLVDYTDGSTLVAADLDTDSTQHLYKEQELDDDIKQSVYVDPTTGLPTASNQRITNVLDPVAAQDAATKNYVDTTTVASAGDTMTGPLAMSTNKITGVGDPTNAQDASTKNYTDTQDALRLKRDGTQPMTGNLNFNSNKGINLAEPTNPQDAATKNYVDNTFVDNTTDLIDSTETWVSNDTKIATTAAADARHTMVVNPTIPTVPAGGWQVGKTWLQNDPNKTLSYWTGSNWSGIASGGTFTLQPTVIYVDSVNGDDANDGHRIINPKKTIKNAVQSAVAGDIIKVAPGVYQEVLPIDITVDNLSIVGDSQRSCFVHPTVATQEQIMFRCNSGTYIDGFTFAGLKASGARGGNAIDSDATYGLPASQGWVAGFYPGCTIKKSPYINNCSNFADASIDNSAFNPNNYAGTGGDLTSAPTGGGIIVDGSLPAVNSPLRSFVVNEFTQVCLDGPGLLVCNNGYAQAVSFFALFCHYHAKALSGGQINMEVGTTDFGRYGLIADGKSSSAIFTATANGNASAGATTFAINAPSAAGTWFGDATRPAINMLVQIGADIYPILSATANGGGWNVVVSRPDPSNRAINLGLINGHSSGATVSFFLRSMISTASHTMEYAGSGTNYNALPENGGVPVEANEVVNLNNGKVWLTSTDQSGKFKVGDTFQVDQQTGFVTIDPSSYSPNIVQDLTPELGGNLDVLTRNIYSSLGNVYINDTLEVNSGTAAAPAITFNGDTNTGIYRPGADQVAISTGGSGRLFVDASGNVGVGAGSPTQLLHVNNASGAARCLIQASGTSNAELRLQQSTGTVQIGTNATNFYFYDPAARDIDISTNGVERLRITSTGLVGIGTSAPGTAKLAVTDSPANISALISIQTSGAAGGISGTAQYGLKSRVQQANNNTYAYGIYSETYDQIGLGTTAGYFQTVTAGANAGVNNTAIRAIGLHPGGGSLANAHGLWASASGVGSTTTYGTAYGALIQNTAICNTSIGLQVEQSSGAAACIPFRVLVDSTERARIDSSGRLLVGTSTAVSGGEPSNALFQVQGRNGGAGEEARIAFARGEGATAITNNEPIGTIYFCDNAGNTFADIRCSADATAGTNDYPGKILFSTTADGASYPTERLRISSNGQISASLSNSTINANALLSLTRSYSVHPGKTSDYYGIYCELQSSGGNVNNTAAIFGLATNDYCPGVTGKGGTTVGVGYGVQGWAVGNTDGYGSNYGVYSRLQQTGSTNGTLIGLGIDLPNYLGYSQYTSTGIRYNSDYTGSGTQTVLNVVRNNTTIGTITTSTTATAYNTSSDYRLKENVVPLVNAIPRLLQVPVHRFNFIASPDATVDGFIAHEVAPHVPEAVTGQKDEMQAVPVLDENGNPRVDEDGNAITEQKPLYQGIDQSKLVPLLTAALQEAIGEIESLKARVAALESA